MSRQSQGWQARRPQNDNQIGRSDALLQRALQGGSLDEENATTQAQAQPSGCCAEKRAQFDLWGPLSGNLLRVLKDGRPDQDGSCRGCNSQAGREGS